MQINRSGNLAHAKAAQVVSARRPRGQQAPLTATPWVRIKGDLQRGAWRDRNLPWAQGRRLSSGLLQRTYGSSRLRRSTCAKRSSSTFGFAADGEFSPAHQPNAPAHATSPSWVFPPNTRHQAAGPTPSEMATSQTLRHTRHRSPSICLNPAKPGRYPRFRCGERRLRVSPLELGHTLQRRPMPHIRRRPIILPKLDRGLPLGIEGVTANGLTFLLPPLQLGDMDAPGGLMIMVAASAAIHQRKRIPRSQRFLMFPVDTDKIY
jgi:hypothetical protein